MVKGVLRMSLKWTGRLHEDLRSRIQLYLYTALCQHPPMC